MVRSPLLEPSVLTDPYRAYGRLRQQDPVHWDDGLQAWLVTRYFDAAEILRDPGRFSSARARGLSTVLFSDPPDHTRLRGVVSPLFAARALEALRSRIEAVAGRLVAQAADRHTMEFVSDFAYRLPATVVGGLLGLPGEDAELFRQWNSVLAYDLEWNLATEVRDQVRAARAAMAEYLARHISDRRSRLGDDLISHLIAVEQRSEELSAEEGLGMVYLLLLAGIDSTAQFVALSLLALLEHPEELERIRDRRAPVETAVEELLRFISPAQLIARRTRSDTEIGGQLIKASQTVLVVVAAANRDPAVFAEPDRLDLRRRPNPHLAFGRGIHFCLGTTLARLEAQIALRALVDGFPNLALAGKPDIRPTLTLRGLRSMPVSF